LLEPRRWKECEGAIMRIEITTYGEILRKQDMESVCEKE
jgi:NAD-dependent SIR2 family protein deacetylase